MATQKKHYDSEKQGQRDFFERFGIDCQGTGSILVDNADGVFHGNVLEFRLNINNRGKVLFQAVKYLSRLRIKGEPVPTRILLIDLNATKIYVYDSADYIDEIQKVYVGAATKGNDVFSKGCVPVAEYDYAKKENFDAVRGMLFNEVENPKGLYKGNPTDWYVPIDLDENCIVGWAEAYYRDNPKATKGDFLGEGTGEIRDPKHFAGLIKPYKEVTNEKFKYLMDCLNERLNQKDLGAFYTPALYCRKAAELVEMAVEKVPDGHDYIILDRCAGTGNLEDALYGRYDKHGDEIISHCVVSTYEYYEYKVLLERMGQDVREVVPPADAEDGVIFENGKVLNADAMSREYIDNPTIRKYVEDPNCTIILFENPPYADSSASDNAVAGDRTNKAKSNRKNTYVAEQFKNNIKKFKTEQASSRELSNLFIWSAFEYYLRQPTDCYIVFSPVKYFKSIGLVKKQMVSGFAFNREYFHASASVISCVLWSNVDETKSEWDLRAFDIVDNKLVDIDKTIRIRAVGKSTSKYADLRKFDSDVETYVYCGSNGCPIEYDYKKGRHPIYNDNIIGYMTAINFPVNAINYRLTRCNTKSELEQSFGFHLRRDNYLEKLPVWCSKLYAPENWYDRDVYFSTADGGDAYVKDRAFLKACLIYTCLSNQNKCMSFVGRDGRYYRNELCFDDTHGDTAASGDLRTMELDPESEKLLNLWGNILAAAKNTKGYDPDLTYGVYQITKELNATHEEGVGTHRKTVFDYPDLNGYLTALRDALKNYYKSHILDKMFAYELLK